MSKAANLIALAEGWKRTVFLADSIRQDLIDVLPLFPLDGEKLAGLSRWDANRCLVVATQTALWVHTLDRHVFRLALEIYHGDEKTKFIIDVANQLEGLRIVPSARQWIVLLDLRNYFLYNYPFDPAMMAMLYNNCIAAIPELLEILHCLYEGAIAHGWLAADAIMPPARMPDLPAGLTPVEPPREIIALEKRRRQAKIGFGGNFFEFSAMVDQAQMFVHALIAAPEPVNAVPVAPNIGARAIRLGLIGSVGGAVGWLTRDIFPMILILEGYDPQTLAPGEKTRLLLALSLIRRAEDWQALVDLRNALVHEASADTGRQEEHVGAALAGLRELDVIRGALNAYAQRRDLLPAPDMRGEAI